MKHIERFYLPPTPAVLAALEEVWTSLEGLSQVPYKNIHEWVCRGRGAQRLMRSCDIKLRASDAKYAAVTARHQGIHPDPELIPSFELTTSSSQRRVIFTTGGSNHLYVEVERGKGGHESMNRLLGILEMAGKESVNLEDFHAHFTARCAVSLSSSSTLLILISKTSNRLSK